MIGVNDNMSIGAMNIGELKALLVEILQDNLGNPASRSNATAAPKRYIYGIKGIEELFGCSHATAQHYKDTILADAVTQNGRKIVVDVELAMQLFGQNKKKGGAPISTITLSIHRYREGLLFQNAKMYPHCTHIFK